MQLVLVAHGRCATFEVRHVGIVVGHDERALKLAGLRSIDAEIGAQFHRATHTLGDVNERAVAEHCRVERGVEIVGIRHHAAQILAHQVGIVLHGLAHRAEYHAEFSEFLAIGGFHAHAVHHGVDGHAAEPQLLLQGDAKFVEGALQFRVDFAALGSLFLLGRGIITDVLEVEFGHSHMTPCRDLEREPVAVSLQSELQQPLRLALQGRDAAHHILVEPLGNHRGVDVGHKAIAILLVGRLVDYVIVFILHTYSFFCCSRAACCLSTLSESLGNFSAPSRRGIRSRVNS